jgi:hypothetical protein
MQGDSEVALREPHARRDVAYQNAVLNSFIVSNTPSAEVAFWLGGRDEARKRHVLFQDEDKATHIEMMLSMITASGQTAVSSVVI